MAAIGYRLCGLNAVTAFWTAYVLTRPVGASVGAWLGKPTHNGGVGVGAGPVALILALLILTSVTYLAITRCGQSPET